MSDSNDMPNPSQWDSLALVWEMLERHGLHESHLFQLQQWLDSPTLIVGAGQGLLMESLRAIGIKRVTGLDFSSAMAAAAWERRRQKVIVGDASDMPFDASQFDSVVCATGVLNPLLPTQMQAVFQEMLRVTRDGGTWIVSLFRPSAESVKPGSELGYFEAGTQYHDRMFKLWQHRHDEPALALLVSQWTGCDPIEAQARIRSQAETLTALYEWVESFKLRLEWLGQDAERELPNLFSWRITGMISEEMPAVFRHPRLNLMEELYDEIAATQIYVFRLLPT